MQVTVFQIRFNAFLFDSEASIPFLGPMSITWMSWLLTVWSVDNMDLIRKLRLQLRDAESNPAFPKIPAHTSIGEFGIRCMNVSFSVISATLLETVFLLEAEGEELKRGI